MRMEVPLRTFAVFLLFASAAAAASRVAVLPLEPRAGALAAADALALTQDLRAAVADALAPHGYETVAASGADASAAMESTGASAAVLGRAAQMEGATVIAVGVYKAGSNSPAAIVRVVGIGSAQLKTDLRAKLPKFVATALGRAPPPGPAGATSQALPGAASSPTPAATRAPATSSTERGPARDPDPRDHRGRRADPRHPPQAEPQGADPGRQALLGSGTGEGEEGADAGGGGRRARSLVGLHPRSTRRRSRPGAARRPRRAGGRVLRSVHQAALRSQGPAGLRGRRDGTRWSPADPRARDRACPPGPELRDPRPGRATGRRRAPGPQRALRGRRDGGDVGVWRAPGAQAREGGDRRRRGHAARPRHADAAAGERKVAPAAACAPRAARGDGRSVCRRVRARRGGLPARRVRAGGQDVQESAREPPSSHPS